MNTQAASRPETAASDLGRPFAEPLAETVPAWDDGPAPGPPEVGGLQRDGLVLLVGTALVGIANYGFVLALVWILPSHQFSELASINSILLVLITVANAALPWVVARAVVRSTPGSPMRRQALTVTIAVSLACAGAGFLILLALSASYASPALEACAALIVVLAFLVQAGSGYLQGRRLFATLGILMVVEAAIKVGVGSLLAIAVGASGALIGAATGIGLVAAVSLWLARRDIGRSGLPLRAYPWRQISGVGAVQAGVSALAMLDVIVGSLLLGPSRAMAGYQAMLVFARVPLFVTGALSAAVYSRLAANPGRQAQDGMVRHAAAAYRSLVAPLVAGACTVPAAILLLLLPHEYRSSFHLLVPLAIAGAASGWLNLLTTCYQAESAFSWPVVLLWGSIPIAAELEVRFSGTVTGLAWTAAAVDSAVALLLVGAACRRYRRAHLPGAALGAVAIAAVAIAILGPVSRLPWLWCALAIPVAAASWVAGRSRNPWGAPDPAVTGRSAMPGRLARPLRRALLKTWTVLASRVRPLAPPAAWAALVAVRSVAGSGPVVCVPSAGRALVLAPHPDDETIGCGGTIARMTAAGAAVQVVVASRGEASVAEPGALAAETGKRRMAEIMAAADMLGARAPVCLDLPDGDLAGAADNLTNGLRRVLAAARPEIIFTPWPLDDHPDHRAASSALAAALRDSGLEHSTEVWAYEVWAALPANRIVDVTPVWPQKQAALDQHRCGRVSFDLDAHLALARWRSIFVMDGWGYAEAFLALPAVDFCDLIEGLEA